MTAKAIRAALMTARRMARADGGEVGDDAERMTNGLGLYSHGAEVASNLPQARGTPQQMTAMLAKGGVKPAEMEHADLAGTFGAQPSVSRDELAEHFASSMPRLQRTDLHEDEGDTQYHGYTIPGGSNYRESLLTYERPPHPARAKADKINNDFIAGRYKTDEEKQAATNEFYRLRDEERAAGTSPIDYFRSSHWSEPNVVAHLRLKDRIIGPSPVQLGDIGQRMAAAVGAKPEHLGAGAADAAVKRGAITPAEADSYSKMARWQNGYEMRRGLEKKLLHLEELQSDWGQKARKEGIYDPRAPWEVFDANTRQTVSKQPTQDEALDETARLNRQAPHIPHDYDDMSKVKAPPGPYIGNTAHWTDLGLKTALLEAAHGGYDKIVWTPGEAQADRYGLGKVLSHISVVPVEDGRMWWPVGKVHGSLGGLKTDESGKITMADRAQYGDVVGRNISDVLGRSVAEKGLAADRAAHETRIEGDDLKVGGEGMRGYYDNILPKRLLALARQHDSEAQLGRETIGHHDAEGKPASTELPALAITPKMRASIRRGLPAFKEGGKVESSLFDLGKLHETPDVAQFDLPRYTPPRGVSARVTDLLNDKGVFGRMADVIAQGEKMGGKQWYNAEPLRHAFVRQLGEDHGNDQFRRYMNFVAAASPRSSVGENVRNASYYYHRHIAGDLPEIGSRNPAPYGHLAQKLHQMNAQRVAGLGRDPLNNPKPASFAQNLMGNQRPVAVDTHAFRLPAILSEDPRFLETALQGEKGTKPRNIQKEVAEGAIPMSEALRRGAFWAGYPKENEYGAMEGLYQRLAQHTGMTPAQAQASGWIGGGKLTGLASDETKPFMGFFEDRIHKTAADAGIEPQEVLNRFVRGEMPLRKDGGSVVDRALAMTRPKRA